MNRQINTRTRQNRNFRSDMPRSTRNNINNNLRLSNLKNEVMKTEPFLIRRNRQILSIPSHKESGLNIERVFRIPIPEAASGPRIVTSTNVATAVLSELSIATTVSPMILTLKEAKIYSDASFAVSAAYNTNLSGGGVSFVSFSDMTNSAGIASVEFHYPVSSRYIFSTAGGTNPIFTITQSTPVGATNDIYLDVLLSVHSVTGNLEPPTVKSEVQLLTERIASLEANMNLAYVPALADVVGQVQ